MRSGPARPGSRRSWVPCHASYEPSSEGLRDSWRWSRPRCLGRDLEADGRNAAEAAQWSSWGMIIGRSLAPLNSSRTLRAVTRRETGGRSVTTTRAGKCRMFVRTARRTFRPAGGKRAATHIGVTLINRSASTSGDSLDPERATGNVIWWNGGFDLDRDVQVNSGCADC